MVRHIGIIGSSGAIGNAVVKRLINTEPSAIIHTFSSSSAGAVEGAQHIIIDYADEQSIQDSAKEAAEGNKFDLVIVATGILHDEGQGIAPEKSLHDLSSAKFEALFAVNTIFPALAAKHFLPLMRKDGRAVFAALSARVGSVSDNQVGGWYAYRSSKSALNMILKNTAIEIARRHREFIILGMHPGTVDSNLSKPFQGSVKHEIFTPDQSATYLLDVIEKAVPADSGKCFAWNGEEIAP